MLGETFSKCAQRADKESCRWGANRRWSSVESEWGAGAEDRIVNINSAEKLHWHEGKKGKKLLYFFFSLRAAKFHSLKRTQKKRMSR